MRRHRGEEEHKTLHAAAGPALLGGEVVDEFHQSADRRVETEVLEAFRHDAQRLVQDALLIFAAETQTEANNYFDWHATVIKDNHESIPLLYVMSGTGPYNDTYDPTVKAEWNLMAWWDVTKLTEYNMPGVWTVILR
jgi:hypothetical protein